MFLDIETVEIRCLLAHEVVESVKAVDIIVKCHA